MKTKEKEVGFILPEVISIERVSFLINEKGILPEIANINLEMVKMKMHNLEEMAWTEEQCDSAEIEYKRFLTLNKLYPEARIVPNKIMDEVWHYHILDTRAYCKDSQEWNGGYFHHFPYFGLRGDQDKENLINSFEETKKHYNDTFGESMVRSEFTDCWHDCEGRCWHECSSKNA